MVDRDILLRKNFDYLQTNSEKFFVDTAKEWLAKLGETVPAKEEDPEKILLLLVNKLCHSHHLILIDSFEYILTGNEDAGWGNFVDDWWNKFFNKILSAESCESRFIITSQDLPTQLQETGSKSPNFFNYQILKGLEESQQIELFKKYGLNCDGQTKPLLTRIGKAYMGHPLAIKVIAKEIKIDFNGNVVEYWKKSGSEIEKVEKSLEEAKQGNTQGKDDWELDRYSKQLRREVKHRLKITFERLEKNSYIAFILICKVSVYRKPERESAWLAQLKSTHKTIEIRQALDILKDRALVETIYDSRTKQNLLGLHNLIRSQALHSLRTIDKK